MLLAPTRSRNEPVRRRRVETAYVAVSLGVDGLQLWHGRMQAPRA